MTAPEEFLIRAGTIADLDVMYELDTVCFDEVFRFSRAAIRRFSQGPTRFTFIAEALNGELAGFVILSLHIKYGLGYIVTLDVSPTHRRRGVAALLMNAAEQHAAADPVDKIELHVYSGNTGALELYTRRGYIEIGFEEAFYGEGLDALVLRKSHLAPETQ